MNLFFQDYIKVKSGNSNMLEKSYNVGHKEKCSLEKKYVCVVFHGGREHRAAN